jgi:hypothetical protein
MFMSRLPGTFSIAVFAHVAGVWKGRRLHRGAATPGATPGADGLLHRQRIERFSERFLVANVLAQTSAVDSWTLWAPARPYQDATLWICARRRLA